MTSVYNLVTSSNINFYIDNLQFTEVDMIPFIQLGTESSVNQIIQAPYLAFAPPLNNPNTNFSLINNLNVSESYYSVIQSDFVVLSTGTSFANQSNFSSPNTLSNLITGKNIPNQQNQQLSNS